MSYSIGAVADTMGISISTLRYYDREGLLPDIERSHGGIRVFSENELGRLRIIECLKNSGMSIKNIKQFLDWCGEGDSSLDKRRDMFYERLDAVNKQMEQLQKTLNTIKFKCWYYDAAVEAGTEEAPQRIPFDQMPKDIQACKLASQDIP